MQSWSLGCPALGCYFSKRYFCYHQEELCLSIWVFWLLLFSLPNLEDWLLNINVVLHIHCFTEQNRVTIKRWCSTSIKAEPHVVLQNCHFLSYSTRREDSLPSSGKSIWMPIVSSHSPINSMYTSSTWFFQILSRNPHRPNTFLYLLLMSFNNYYWRSCVRNAHWQAIICAVHWMKLLQGDIQGSQTSKQTSKLTRHYLKFLWQKCKDIQLTNITKISN